MPQRVFGVIPARMAASRFPGKPLAEICGKSMLRHVADTANRYEGWHSLCIATCDQEIVDHINGDFNTILTSDRHTRALDRVAEAYERICDKPRDDDLVVCVQGDEPMVHPEMISQAVQPLIDDPNIFITNLLGRIRDKKEFHDKNTIKVVCDNNQNALYFSRESIPTKSFNNLALGKQVPIIPFRRDFLIKYNELKPTPLEIAESVDMLRILEYGMKILMVPTSYDTHAVDTIEDLNKVQLLLKTSIV